MNEKFEIDSQWSGILSYTKNKLPFIKKENNIVYFGGMSGHGVAFAFIYAKDII